MNNKKQHPNTFCECGSIAVYPTSTTNWICTRCHACETTGQKHMAIMDNGGTRERKYSELDFRGSLVMRSAIFN